jgi:hypothetical protein
LKRLRDTRTQGKTTLRFQGRFSRAATGCDVAKVDRLSGTEVLDSA